MFKFPCSLDAIHPDAYDAFQASRDLKTIISDALKSKGGALTVQASLMTPVLPMLVNPFFFLLKFYFS